MLELGDAGPARRRVPLWYRHRRHLPPENHGRPHCSNNTGLASYLSAMLVTTAGAGVDDLLRVHNGQGATAAMAATVQDFKLA